MAVPVSFTARVAPEFKVAATVAPPASVPAPESTVVPPFSVNTLENTAEFAAVKFRVPGPYFSMPHMLPEKSVPRLIVPAPVNASVLPEFTQVPFRFSVVPARAPIAPSLATVNAPVSVLAPDMFSI